MPCSTCTRNCSATCPGCISRATAYRYIDEAAVVAREFIQSPADPLPPNGAKIVMDLISIFRFDDNGRLIEEFVRSDYRSLLCQLGVEAR